MIVIQIAETLFPEAENATNDELPFDRAILERSAQEALQKLRPGSELDMSIVLSDDDQLQALNRQFLGVDAPTDVLSFPADEPEPDPDSQVQYLGDILISYPRAVVQAAAGGHALLDELQLLIVHGVLHLLGYDHTTQDEKAAMWALQAEILTGLGSSVTIPPE
jgi:probable rRNA maturation factor